MKKRIILSIILISAFSLIRAQDVITKTDSSQIKVKVKEIGPKSIKYLKYNFLTGPVFNISRKKVLSIRYVNGDQQIFHSKKSILTIFKPSAITDSLCKHQGIYMGAHYSPGIGGTRFTNIDGLYAFNAGFDFNYYFNQHIGIGSGISYLSLPLIHSEENISAIDNENALGTSFVGIPVHFLLLTGKRFGYYMETGLGFYLSTSDTGSKDSNLLIDAEINSGIHYEFNSKLSLTGGLYGQYGLTGSLTHQYENRFLLGAIIGFHFKLSENSK